MKSEKTAIHNAFAKAASLYSTTAQIQERAANDLALLTFDTLSNDTPGTMIDLGCGTGFLAQAMYRFYPGIQITLNDLSTAMIKKAISTPLSSYLCVQLKGDIEDLKTNRKWDLTASNFVWQWLENPEQAFKTWADRSRYLALSVPLEGSFKEWKDLHQRLSLPLRLRRLPTSKDLHRWVKTVTPAYFEIHEKKYSQTLSAPIEFARQLKATGASVSRSPVSASSLRKIDRATTEPFTVTWKVGFIILKMPKTLKR